MILISPYFLKAFLHGYKKRLKQMPEKTTKKFKKSISKKIFNFIHQYSDTVIRIR